MFTVFFLLVFIYVTVGLFFPQVLTLFRIQIGQFFSTQTPAESTVRMKELVIAYADGISSFEPTLANPSARSRLLNIYEPLIKFDGNLHIKPALAASWGRIDDKTWEFRIRPNVHFHNNRLLNVEDVVVSIERAKNPNVSELASLLKNIVGMRKIAVDRFQVITGEPDPLLLNKLASVLIFPAEFDGFKNEANGTGPYMVESNKMYGDLFLKRFSRYWGEMPYFESVKIRTIPDKDERVNELEERKIHLLVNVPPGEIDYLTAAGISILSRPNLQVNFVLFNMENKFLAQNGVRSALKMLFDKDRFLQLTSGYARPVNQFVSNGIFGYDPNITGSEADLEVVKEFIIGASGFERPRLSLHMIQGLEKVGAYIVEQFDAVGIGVSEEYLSDEDLSNSIKEDRADMYFLGWKSELGDADDFFQAIAASHGQYNINYYSARVDDLLKKSAVNLEVDERREQLRELMKILVDEDVIGIPLYESEVIYGVAPQIDFTPRIDTYVLAAELRAKTGMK